MALHQSIQRLLLIGVHVEPLAPVATNLPQPTAPATTDLPLPLAATTTNLPLPPAPVTTNLPQPPALATTHLLQPPAPATTDLRQPRVPATPASPMTASSAHAPPDLLPLIEAVSAPHHTFDQRAIDYGHRYRSGFWAIYLLSAIAVLFAVLPLALGWDSSSHRLHPYAGFWAVGEVLVIGTVSAIYWLGHRRDWQGEWLRARTTAELTWYLPMLAPLLDFSVPSIDADTDANPGANADADASYGANANASHGANANASHSANANASHGANAGTLTDADIGVERSYLAPESNWYLRVFDPAQHLRGADDVAVLCRRIEPLAREQLAGAWRDSQFVESYVRWTISILEQQRQYHHRIAGRQHALLHRVHLVNGWLFSLTAVGALLHLAIHTLWLSLVTTFFPALGASLHGALAQSEAYRLSTTSQRLVSELEVSIRRIRIEGNELGSQFDAAPLKAAVKEALSLILEEHQDWHLLVRPHHLPLA